MGSPWSKVVGIPVSVLSLVLYGTMLALTWRPFGYRRWALIALAVAAGGAGLWFLGLQLLVLNRICAFCSVVHGCSLFTAVAMLVARSPNPSDRSSDRRQSGLGIHPTRRTSRPSTALPRESAGKLFPAVSGIAAVLVLVALQIAFPAPTMEVVELPDDAVPVTPAVSPVEPDQPLRERQAPVEKTESPARPIAGEAREDTASRAEVRTALRPDFDRPSRTIRYLKGKLVVRLDNYPLLGSPRAQHVIVKLFDYTCPSCDHVHKILEKCRLRYGDQFSIVAIPMPLNKKCNHLVKKDSEKHVHSCYVAGAAYAIWNYRRDAFPTFHKWLFLHQKSLTPELIRERAGALMDQAEFDRAVDEELTQSQISRSVQVYELCLAGGLPTMVVGRGNSVLIRGKPTTRQLFEVLERRLGLRPL